MPTDEKALREKLEAMVEALEKPEREASCDGSLAVGAKIKFLQAVALDLLRRLGEREVPCVWSVDDDGIWTASCGEVEWCFNDGGPVENKVKRCCGCGHPVQVKQPQDAAEEE